ncbi:MAG: CYTH domain-containing protein [Daejeonella sp.]
MIYKDFTLKAKVTNLNNIERLLATYGAIFKGVDHQRDIYFNAAVGKLKLRQGTIENLITHYERIDDNGIEKTIVYQYDLNPSEEQKAELYRQYDVIGIIEKTRKIYFINNVKIHLDTTQHNEIFIELEAIDINDSMGSETLRTQCMEIKSKLNIPDSDLIKTGYLR